MVELITMSVVVLVAAAAESLHLRATRRVARLAFGPGGQPAWWVRMAPALRVAALGALSWGLSTLYVLDAKSHRPAEEIPESEKKHLILVLDVSPSMRLKDAGPERKQSRMQRARDVLDSLFGRVGIRQYLISVVATYNGAIPVVERSRDPEVLRNILSDLPMHYAFPKGNTDLFAGLEEAARIAKPLRPNSATLLLVTDGDTVPATGMPKLPPSIASRLVIGVGDSRQGTFIDGRHSRQEASVLGQLAIRLGGLYHDANERHVGSEILRTISQSGDSGRVDRLTRREYALLACGLGAAVVAFLPYALQRFGTAWRPGVQALPMAAGTPRPAAARSPSVTRR